MRDLLSPLVSVIIPVYNAEEYLLECVNSVRNQTYKNIEILCIDDCGFDNSIDVLTDLAEKDSRVRIVRHEVNRGLGPVRNTGLNVASGEFIYFLDADDYIDPKTIGILVKRIVCDKSDVAMGGALGFPNDNSFLLVETARNLNTWLNLNGEEEGGHYSYFQALDKIPCVVWGKLFRMEFIRKNKLKFIDAKVRHEDNGFHAKYMACNPKISFVKDVCYYYRIRFGSQMDFGGGVTTKENDLRLSIEDSLEYILSEKKNIIYAEILKDRYWKFFSSRKFGVLFYWGKYFKIVKLWNLTLMKIYPSKDVMKLRLLCVTVRRWKLSDSSLM